MKKEIPKEVHDWIIKNYNDYMSFDDKPNPQFKKEIDRRIKEAEAKKKVVKKTVKKK